MRRSRSDASDNRDISIRPVSSALEGSALNRLRIGNAILIVALCWLIFSMVTSVLHKVGVRTQLLKATEEIVYRPGNRRSGAGLHAALRLYGLFSIFSSVV